MSCFQWSLVCGKEPLVDMSQTIMVVGVMVGAMVFSASSDVLGRKPTFLFSEWAMVVVGVLTAFSFNYYVFCVLRFFAGALQQVRSISTYDVTTCLFTFDHCRVSC